MRRREFIAVGSLLVPAACLGQAFTFRDPAMKTNQTTGCTGTLQTTIASALVTSNFADSSGHTYTASKFTAGSSFTACTVSFNFKRSGSGTAATLTGRIWSDNSGVPGTLQGTSTNTIASASVDTAAAADYTFAFAGVSITNGTVYWVGISAGSVSATDFYVASVGALNSGTFQQGSDGSSWSQTSTRGFFSKVYS